MKYSAGRTFAFFGTLGWTLASIACSARIGGPCRLARHIRNSNARATCTAIWARFNGSL